MGRTLLWSIIVAIAMLITWAWHAEIDQSTRVTGQVIPSSRSQVIQAADGGVLEKLLVKQGDQVEKGQLLAVLDRTRSEAAFKETEAKFIALQADLIRLKAEVLDKKPIFDETFKDFPELIQAQKTLYDRRRQAIQEDISSLTTTMNLAKEELSMNLPLVQTGDVSKVDIIKLKRQIADIQFQITTRRNKYFQDAQAELAKAEAELGSVRQSLAQRKDALDRTDIFAPASGFIKNVRFTTLGSTLKSGEELLQIVPMDDDLLIEAKVKPKDVGKLKPGIPATVKIDAYDYTIYGTLSGTLVYLSPDTLEEDLKRNEEPYYRVQIKTEGRNLSNAKSSEIVIQPGMTATVELITGNNTVFKYLVKPIIKTLDESLHEQ
jgi:adhesin transport system membrane fusion protein